jgi:hypothetical protein
MNEKSKIVVERNDKSDFGIWHYKEYHLLGYDAV